MAFIAALLGPIKKQVCNANAEEDKDDGEDEPEDAKPKANSGSGSKSNEKDKCGSQHATMESDSNSDNGNQDGLEKFMFFQQESGNDKAQECAECNELKSVAIKKIQKNLLCVHKCKANQDKNERDVCLHLKQKWKAACLCPAQGKKMLSWMLLDNQSTTDSFGSPNSLTNIRNVNDGMTALTNGGVFTSDVKGVNGCLCNDGNTWCHPDAMTNVSSLSNIMKKHRVIFDSTDDGAFCVHKLDHTVRFRHSDKGSFCHNAQEHDLTLPNAVSENEAIYAEMQLARAKAVHDCQDITCYPSVKDHKATVQSNKIKDCPVTETDIKTAQKVCGPIFAKAKWSTVRAKPMPVMENCAPVPKSVLETQKHVALMADMVFISESPFLLTCGRKLCFLVGECLETCPGTQLCESLAKVTSHCKNRCFVMQ